jgi:hypothetical protein
MRRTSFFLVLFSASAFAAGKVTFERSVAGAAPVPITVLCDSGNARMETGGEPEKKVVLIWDAKQKQLSILHPGTKTYQQIDPDRFSQATGQQPGPDPVVTATATGKKAKVDRWDCEHYNVKRGELQLDMCLVPWAKAPVKKEELSCMASVQAAMRKMGAKEGDATGGDVDKLPGMPVQTTRDLGEGKANVMTLKSVERGPAPSDAFVVPTDYKPGAGPHLAK